MDIKGFIESSLLEWEGKIASVLFLPGCNLRCRYCHAADLVLRSEELETIPPDVVLSRLRRQVGWLDGVVITGGEPTLFGDELLALIRDVRRVPLQVMVETNGTRPECVQRLMEDGLVEAIAMDLKAPLGPEDYARVAGTGVHVEDVRRSLDLIKRSGLSYELRITLVPGLVGWQEVQRMLPDLEGARQVALQNFKPELCLDARLRTLAPFAPEELDAFQKAVSQVAERCVVRGRTCAGAASSRAR
jgi:pyruvate formate lyase activating enzyme